MSDKPDSTTEKYVSIPEYAQMLGISRIAVYARVRKGLLPAKKIGRNFVILLDGKSDNKGCRATFEAKTHLSVADVSKKLGISRVAVFQRIKSGQIPAVKAGRNYIIPIDFDLTSVKSFKSSINKSKLIKVVKDFISIPELAKELDLSRVEVFNRVKSGKIQAKKVGRNYVVRRQTLEQGVIQKGSEKSDPIYVSVPELAKEWGVSRVSVFYKVKKGIIKARKIGRNYVICREDLKDKGRGKPACRQAGDKW